MAKHTPGPWKWRHCYKSNRGFELVATHSGLLLVMDTIRHGMNSADVRFAIRENNEGGLMFKATKLKHNDDRGDYPEITNPDMNLIAASPDLYSVLKEISESEHKYPAGMWDKIFAALAKAEGTGK